MNQKLNKEISAVTIDDRSKTDQDKQVSSNAYWDGFKTADAFLTALEENNVTFEKLKSTVFGKTASKVIKAIKRGGQDCFDDVSKAHQIWWSTKHAICQALKA